MDETGHAIYIAELIAKKVIGETNAFEEAKIQLWVSHSEENRKAYEDILNSEKQLLQFQQLRQRDSTAAFHKLRKRYHKDIRRGKLIRLLPYAAAVAILLAVIGIWLPFNREKVEFVGVEVEAELILPGGSRATLTLDDGREVVLSETRNGIVVGAEGVSYIDGTSLDITPSEGFVLNTPKGGMYQVTLPDGTNVWLNASSTLKYPSRFDNEERVVELIGEAYFEVEPQENLLTRENVPFKVITPNQTVEVLGTQFNISAYQDDTVTKTTLLEGAVRLGGDGFDVILSPGEQGVLHGGQFTVDIVEADDFIGWTKGEFIFNGIELRDAMKQISRWYNVAVEYEGDVPQTNFYGSFSRSSTLAEALEVFKAAKMNFTTRRVGETIYLIINDDYNRKLK